MNWLVFLPGAALIVLVVVDALWTTLWLDGSAGPMTSRMTSWLWRAMRAVIPTGRDRWLSLSGPILLTITVITWIIVLWAGWTLVFSADTQSLLDTRDQTRPDLVGRIYFVAYSMYTMGNGDFSPQGDLWQIATSLTTASGMFLVTLVVSFLLSVISADASKRTLASQITGIADRAESFVRTEWDGKGFPTLESHLNAITTTLGTVTERHRAYPLLHYYHAAKPDKASALAIAVLDDALTLLEYGVHEDVRPRPSVIRPARAAVSSYLDTLTSAFIQPADDIPPPPDPRKLCDAGIPVVDDRQFDAALERLAERRRRLLGMVRSDSYRWPT